MGIVAVFTSDTALITYTNKSMRVYLAMLFIYGIQVACQYSFVALAALYYFLSFRVISFF